MNAPLDNSELPINVLIVDDEPANLLAYEAMLQGLSANLLKAGSGPEALRYLLEHDVAVILLDVRMPGMDGFEAANLIRQRDRSRHTPLIFITGAYKDEVHKFAGYSVGAVDYLEMPVAPEILRSKVSVFVDLFKKREQLKRQAELLREAERGEYERKLALQALEVKLATAREIQQGLFPSAAPELPGFDISGACCPADATGGDYFDYIPMRNGCWGIAVGDASGHGFGPALVMAETRAYLWSLAQQHHGVSDILAQANRLLTPIKPAGHFITLLLVELDPRSQSLVYANAGHPPGYILESSGAVKTTLSGTAQPLGMIADSNFPAASSLQLEPGEIVLLLTDGVFEAGAPDAAMFGIDRALAIVREHRHEKAEAITRSLLRAAREFTEHRPLHDDITAVVIKVGSPRFSALLGASGL